MAGSADGQRVVAEGAGLAPLVWRGLLLTIVTLGIYRFWYRTDLRRWYWGNTRVGGDGFEYRGTPKELFIGFLIALAVTLPLYFAGALAALFLASEMAANVVTLAGLTVLAVLAQYGAYRSRRYRLTRTVWRGLRFDQKGSAWTYAFVSLLWFAATCASLGLLLPLMRRALEGMKVRGTVFGTAEGRFHATAGRLMLIWLPLWLLLLVLAAAALYGFGKVSTVEDDPEAAIAASLIALACAAGVILVFGIGWPIYRAAEFRIFTAGAAIGPVNFRSDLRAASLFGMYLKFGLLTVVLLLVGGVMALGLLGAALATIMRSAEGARAGPFVVAGGLLIYLSGVYVFMATKELVLGQGFWRRAGGSVTATGLHLVAGVEATAVADDAATGEGLADALDFGGV